MWPSVEVEDDRQSCEVGMEMAALQGVLSSALARV